MDIALDFAIQCSADHPWLTEHPEWFNRRPDGTLKYAENPPKRYQDIYNVNWDCEDWQGLWQALLDVVRYWVDHGVRVFRVDNPHTKPVAFWEWLIREVTATDPDVVFLAEAFTRRARLVGLAKAGFTQSYTYFTWKNARWELEQFIGELLTPVQREVVRPNLFANTPDILHEYLQHGGPPAFAARLVLAATLSPTYGIYSGYEHFENVAVRPGSEEYLDSEKYEAKARGPRRAAAAVHPDGQRDPARRTPRCSTSRTSRSSTRRTTGSSPTPSRRRATRSSASSTSIRTTRRRGSCTCPTTSGCRSRSWSTT